MTCAMTACAKSRRDHVSDDLFSPASHLEFQESTSGLSGRHVMIEHAQKKRVISLEDLVCQKKNVWDTSSPLEVSCSMGSFQRRFRHGCPTFELIKSS
jgi:hypothetical protein